ncbi:hypothetical protein V8G54_024426 [Vigna mungo]|uniref:Thionin-like protein n=1 Tax=Vigna mungo TaxID=3915 RepID=A0AAQ3N6E4_VIGMU
MEKIEIKSIAVVIMVTILLNSAQAKIGCDFKCILICIKNDNPFTFRQCVQDCESKNCQSRWDKLSSDSIYNCINSCLNSIAMNNAGTPDIVNNVKNTCIQECKERL